MAAEESKEAASSGGAASGGGSKVLVILTAVNLLITAVVLGVLAYTFKSQKEPSVADIKIDGSSHASGEAGQGAAKSSEELAAEAAKKYGKVIALEQFTVNLSTVGSVTPKFARVNISVQVDSEDTELELTQKMARVRNTVIDLFNSKRPSDLATTEGRSYLKDEIKKALNGFIVTGKVNGVYFTNFALSG